MSKIIEHTSNGFKWLLVEVPEDATGFLVVKNSLRWKISPNKYWWDQLIIPSEGWEIVGKADKFGVSNWMQICEIDEVHKGDTLHKVYDRLFENGSKIIATSDSKKAGLSLLRSHGLKPETTLILKTT